MPFGDSEDRCYDIVTRLKGIIPDARILIVLREQYSYCDSVYRHAVATDIMSRLTPKRFAERHHFLGDYLRYDVAIERWKTQFDSVTAIPYEMLTRNSEEFDRVVCDALGVETVFGQRAEGVGTPLRYITAYRLMNPLFKLFDAMTRRRVGRKRIRNYRDRYIAPVLDRLPGDGRRSDIKPFVRKWDGLWSQSNRNLRDLVDWNPSDYGYRVVS